MPGLAALAAALEAAVLVRIDEEMAMYYPDFRRRAVTLRSDGMGAQRIEAVPLGVQDLPPPPDSVASKGAAVVAVQPPGLGEEVEEEEECWTTVRRSKA